MTDLFPHTVPRPKALSDEQKLEIAVETVKALQCFEGTNLDEAVLDVLAVPDYYTDDGFKMARWLADRKHWECDSGMVEVFDEHQSRVAHKIAALQQQWAVDCNIQPPYPDGTMVKTPWGYVGPIVGVAPHAIASYYIRSEKERESWYSVPFEDVTPVEVEPPAASAASTAQ